MSFEIKIGLEVKVPEGTLEGEACLRKTEGQKGMCDGVMEVSSQSGDSCSCHINPPCSYCTDTVYQCSKCGFETGAPIPTYVSREEYEPVKYKKYEDLDHSKFDYVVEPHTHFSQIYKGKFPPGQDVGDEMKEIEKNGLFGGRYRRFDRKNGLFEYVAYTD